MEMSFIVLGIIAYLLSVAVVWALLYAVGEREAEYGR